MSGGERVREREREKERETETEKGDKLDIKKLCGIDIERKREREWTL